MSMLYEMHEAQKWTLSTYFGIMASTLQLQSRLMRSFNAASMADKFSASAEIAARISHDYTKPEFGLHTTTINGKTVQVGEEVVNDKVFGSLLHFKRHTKRKDPKVLLVAPMSGHYATLLRDTVRELMPHHDVYITDWKDARDIPNSQGNFGLEDYMSYVQDFIETIGPNVHVIAVCQPTVATLSAIALNAEKTGATKPLSLTLMAGPLDTRISPTDVNNYARKNPLSWFKDNVIATVPPKYKGWGRKVYPGFVQLVSFMSMNPDKHTQSHIDLFNHIKDGEKEKAKKIEEFYNEYLAVCDMADQFYLETIHHVFQEHSLPRGTLTWHGQKIDPSKITQTALLTVEGAQDDIVGRGQTLATHVMCSKLKGDQRYSYVQPGAGHFGVFSGRRWAEEICPRVTGFIRTIAQKNGITYESVPDGAAICPKRQTLADAKREIALLNAQTNDNRQNSAAKPYPKAA